MNHIRTRGKLFVAKTTRIILNSTVCTQENLFEDQKSCPIFSVLVKAKFWYLYYVVHIYDLILYIIKIMHILLAELLRPELHRYM